MLIIIEVLAGPCKGAYLSVTRPGVYVVGRSSKAHLCLSEDPYVSDVQFMLKVSPGERVCSIRKVREATNACFVNDTPVVSKEIFESDEITVGFSRMKLSIDWQAEAKGGYCRVCQKALMGSADAEGMICASCLEQEKAGTSENKSDLKDQVCCFHCRKPLELKESKASRSASDPGLEFCCPGCLKYEEDKDDPVSGSKINEYVCLKTLGKGGMGQVVLAYKPGSPRLVAIKYNHKSGMNKRFAREMKILQEMHHENIVRHIEHLEDASGSYLVMQFVRGQNLDDYILERGDIPSYQDTVSMGLKLLDALASIHKHEKGDFLHRDLKPENILLSAKDPLRPMITDFGLAKNKAGKTHMTRIGEVMGTCGYSPYEQLKDASKVTAASDIYALGMILYYCFSGKYPYEYPSLLEVKQEAMERGIPLDQEHSLIKLQNQITRERGMGDSFFNATMSCVFDDRYQPIKLAQRASNNVPAAVSRVIDKAISKREYDRYTDAGSMQKAFEEAVR